MRTVPVNHSAGPLPEGCEAARLISRASYGLANADCLPAIIVIARPSLPSCRSCPSCRS
jgi:hypothetical protein